MRIAILSCFYPYRGGLSQFNANFYTELAKSHCVRAFNFSRQYPDLLFPGKTQYVSDSENATNIESDRVLDSINPLSWYQTAGKIREWHPDVLIIRYWMSFLAPCLGYVAHRMKKHCKVVALTDNIIPHERHFFDMPMAKYFLKGCDGVVTLSKSVAEDLQKTGVECPYAVLKHPLYNNYGEKISRGNAESRLGLETGKKNLLFFGLIRDYKGLDILLEAFGRLDDSYQLIIAGESYVSFDKYQKMIDECPGKDRIHVFQKFIPDEEVKEYFSAADVIVLPYRSATQSGICAIGYHFDVPMIATDVGGLKEAISDTGTGLIASKADPEEIRQAVEYYFSSPKVKEDCISCIQKEKEELSWTTFSNRFVNFVDSIGHDTHK